MADGGNIQKLDLPKRLRSYVTCDPDSSQGEWGDDEIHPPICAEAADEIERLRKGLQMIAYGATETSRGKGMWNMTNVYRVAEDVLNGEKPSYG